MEDFFGTVLGYTLLEMADWNRSDVETEEVTYNSDIECDEIAFE